MIPFPHAHLYVAAFLVVTLAAFAPSYFLVLPDAPLAHHLHGLTATLWIVLLIVQSWSIHHRHRRLHVIAGGASLALVPPFLAGGLLVTQVTLLKDTAFNTMFGTPLAVADLVASVAFPLFYAFALRHRRDPQRHARYMLATLTPLFGPAVSRLCAGYVPGLTIRAAEDLPRFGYSLNLSLLLLAVVLMVLIARDARRARPVVPFVWALGGVVAMYVGYRWGHGEFWRATVPALASVPSILVGSVGVAIGVVAAYLGWRFPAVRRAPVPAPQVLSPAATH